MKIKYCGKHKNSWFCILQDVCGYYIEVNRTLLYDTHNSYEEALFALLKMLED